MSLSKVQQTKIRAALAWLRDKHGPEDVQRLTAMARQSRDQGAPEQVAWNHALNQLHNADPELSDKIAQSFNLLDASDADTLARYEGALSKYVDQGDQSALLEMQPDIARDDATLDFHNGAISKQELDARLVEIDAGNVVPGGDGNAATDLGSNKDAPQSFSFGGSKDALPELGAALPPPRDFGNGSQVSLGGNLTGVVAPNTAREWARNTPGGYASGGTQSDTPQG